MGTTTVPGWLASGDQRCCRYEQLSPIYACGRMSGRNTREVNISKGASVGVNVGVEVEVGVVLGLGEAVWVGVGVLV